MFKRLANLSNREILMIIAVFFASGFFGSLAINLTSNHSDAAAWWENLLQGFTTEMLGAFITFILLNLILGYREQKETLIQQMRSTDPTIALHAAEKLRWKGHHTDGSLREKDFRTATLIGAYFRDADFQGADLAFANLQDTYLYRANLKGVDFHKTELQGANLVDANLQDARCLDDAKFDVETILPDGNNWAQTDLRRFTDPNHPQFWRSENPDSPAYRVN